MNLRPRKIFNTKESGVQKHSTCDFHGYKTSHFVACCRKLLANNVSGEMVIFQIL